MSIPFTVLGGYLGTGKTTLVNHLLKHADGQRLALIINDFGAINIDAELISEQTDDQINLTNGCICCGMSAGFDEALDSLLTRNPLPDRIIVEASGVADVTAFAQYGHHPGLHLDGIIVLADAETVRAKARDRYVDRTVLRQLRGADLIVLNKIDLVTNAAADDVTDWLNGVAPGIPVVRSDHCDVPKEVLFGIDSGSLQPPSHAHLHEDYASWHFTHARPLRRDAVEAFIAALPEAVLRAKGFFCIEPGTRHVFQKVGQRASLTPSQDGSGTGTRLVAIGLAGQLDTARLETLAASLRA